MSELLEARDVELLYFSGESWKEVFSRSFGQSRTTAKELFEDESEFIAALESGPFRDPEAAFSHEQAHMLTAKAVGMTEARYGVIRNTSTGRIGSAVVSLGGFSDVPRLAIAAVSVAPVDPSWGDLDNLTSLGYGRAGEVAGKINAWNETHELQIPLPKSLDNRIS